MHADLDRLLTDSYLSGIESMSLDAIRSMRSECQQAEVALSYLRRLAQGRLDIVYAYLGPSISGSTSDSAEVGAHGDSDGDSDGGGAGETKVGEPLDLASLVEGLPGILTSGPGRPPGPGRLATMLTPDTEEDDLTQELDGVLSANDIGHLGELSQEKLGSMAEGLGEIEQRMSVERRALHQRIDVLQAELVNRYKTGRASVDGLLS